MLPRPRPHRAFGAIRIGITAFLAVHVFISAWLVATVEGSYTEGKPSPTEVHSLVAIDKDRTMVDLEIKKATSFFFYALERDGDAAVATNSSDEKGDAAEEGGSGEDSDVEWLTLGRHSITAALVVLVLSEFLMLAGFKWRHHVRTLAFLTTLVAFSVVFPACYMLELSGGDGDQDSTATNTPGAEIETVSFVHTNASSDLSLIWLGLQLEADFSGYDLGLVEPENRTAVTEQVPVEGSEDASSFIAFESTFEIQLGKNLDILLTLPVMWFLLPSLPLQASDVTSKNEEE
ncbi:MAG: hypothetical protein VW982_04760 [Candidatus Poseidoniales archaeon]